MSPMVDPLSISVSGLQVQSLRLAGSASNVANLRSTGPLAPAEGERAAYQPVETVQQPLVAGAGEGAGTRAFFRPANPAVTAEFQPDDPAADTDGLVAAPNVSLEREAVTQTVALRGFQANLAAFRTADDLLRETLDLKA